MICRYINGELTGVRIHDCFIVSMKESKYPLGYSNVIDDKKWPLSLLFRFDRSGYLINPEAYAGLTPLLTRY